MAESTQPIATGVMDPTAGVAVTTVPATVAEFGPEPTPASALPDPVDATVGIAQAIIDVLIGQRPVAQINSCTSNAVRVRIMAMLDTAPRRESLKRARQRVASVRVTVPAPGVIEASVVVRGVRRAQAMALRLEGWDGRWQCTALRVG